MNGLKTRHIIFFFASITKIWDIATWAIPHNVNGEFSRVNSNKKT